MRIGLWSWQSRDCGRLRKEGKTVLADYWGKLSLASDPMALAPEKFGAAAAQAAKDAEPHWELLYGHFELQQALLRKPRPLDGLLRQAEHLSALGETRKCATCPQRFCVQEDLFTVWLLVDGPGHAEEILSRIEARFSSIPSHLDCNSCFRLLRIQALIEAGRLEEAEPACKALFKRTDVSPDTTLLSLLFWAEIAARSKDTTSMAMLLSKAREIAKGSPSINPDNRWLLERLEARFEILTNHLEAAVERAKTSRKTMPPGSMEAIRMNLDFASAAAEKGDWKASLHHAEAAWTPALKRGMRRFASEAGLLAAEACARLGDPAKQKKLAAELAPLIRALKTRDLDDRARAVGVSGVGS